MWHLTNWNGLQHLACARACVCVVVCLRVPHQPPVWADWSPALIKAALGFTSAAETKAGWHFRECVSHIQTHTLTAYMHRKNQCWSTHILTHIDSNTLCAKKKKKPLLQLTRSASDELTQIHISEHTQNNQCPIRFCNTPYTPTPQSFSYSTKWLNTKQWKVTECGDTL